MAQAAEEDVWDPERRRMRLVGVVATISAIGDAEEDPRPLTKRLKS